MMYTLIDFVILVVALGGFSIAAYIRNKKSKKQPLVCPLRSNCDTVIHSDHSKFFGIPVEILGILYYLIVVGYHLFLIFKPVAASPLLVLLSLLLSTVAFVFSIYLTAIQAFVLRQWCAWCLTSATFCLIIFVLTIVGSPFPFTDIVTDYGRVFTIFHLLGVALGVGAATITDIFFFKFLNDYKISFLESDILKTLSQIIWFALFLLLISGVALFIPKSEILVHSGKFMVKMIGIIVLIVNGFVLNIIIAPKLAQMTFTNDNPQIDPQLTFLRNVSFALGAVSISSWYFIFILGALRGVTLPLIPLLGGYIALLTCAVVGSQIFGYLLTNKKLPSQN